MTSWQDVCLFAGLRATYWRLLRDGTECVWTFLSAARPPRGERGNWNCWSHNHVFRCSDLEYDSCLHCGNFLRSSHSNDLKSAYPDYLFVGCLMFQPHASISPGRICTDNFTCCHTEIGVADQTFHLTQSQYTDTGPTSPSTDPITTGAWQGSHWSANF